MVLRKIVSPCPRLGADRRTGSPQPARLGVAYVRIFFVDIVDNLSHADAVRYKIRQLISALLEAGHTCNTQRGKGSPRGFYHPSGKTITICHHGNDDAPPYLEKQVAKAIHAAKGEGESSPSPAAQS